MGIYDHCSSCLGLLTNHLNAKITLELYFSCNIVFEYCVLLTPLDSSVSKDLLYLITSGKIMNWWHLDISVALLFSLSHSYS